MAGMAGSGEKRDPVTCPSQPPEEVVGNSAAPGEVTARKRSSSLFRQAEWVPR